MFFFFFRKKPFSTDQDAITKRQLCDRRNTQKKQERVRCGKGVMGDLFCLRSCLKNETLDWILITFKRQRKIVESFDRWISNSINMELFELITRADWWIVFIIKRNIVLMSRSSFEISELLVALNLSRIYHWGENYIGIANVVWNWNKYERNQIIYSLI